MKCPICGGATAKLVRETRLGHYRRETVQVESEMYRCEACNEGFFTPTQLAAHNRTVKNEIRKRFGLLPPARIAEIRTKLGLTQAELEDLFEIGPKVVVRWESGKVIQSSAHDSLLRLLEADPGKIETLRQIKQARLKERDRHEPVAV